MHQLQSQPHRPVPARILANIFHHLVPSAPDESDPLRLLTEFDDDMKTLCLVCSRWKRIAYGTPALWSTIVLVEGTSSLRVARHLDRSCFHPLRICIVGRATITARRGAAASSDFDRCMAMAKAHYHRWKTLWVFNVHDALRAILPPKLPHLAEVTFRDVTIGSEINAMPIVYAPRLQHLTATTASSIRGQSYYSAFNGCENLRRVAVSEPRSLRQWRQLRIFLSSNAQHIMHLKIGSHSRRRNLTIPTKPVFPGEEFSLPYLATLVLDGTSNHNWILRRLYAPSLNRIIVNGGFINVQNVWRSAALNTDLVCGDYADFSTTDSLVTYVSRSTDRTS